MGGSILTSALALLCVVLCALWRRAADERDAARHELSLARIEGAADKVAARRAGDARQAAARAAGMPEGLRAQATKDWDGPTNATPVADLRALPDAHDPLSSEFVDTGEDDDVPQS